MSRFVWVFCALFQRYFFPAFFREALLPRTFLKERLPLALSWGIFRAILRMDNFHGLFSGLFSHAFFRSADIHGLIPGSLFRALICSYFLSALIRRTFFHVLFCSPGFFCINFRKAFTVGSFPMASSVLSFPRAFSVFSLTGDIPVRFVRGFLLAFLRNAFFPGCCEKAFPCVLPQQLFRFAPF